MTAPFDKRVPDLPSAAAVSDADLLIKWDGTQTSGQRLQCVTAAKFGTYAAAKVPLSSIGIGTVTTLAAGSPATASLSGAPPTYTLNLGIPAGPSGSNIISGTPTAGQVATWVSASMIQGQSLSAAGIASSGANSTITSLTGLTTALSAAQGGTGSTAAATGTGGVVLATGPTLSNPVVGTQTAGNNSTLAASTAFVAASYAPIASPTFTGTPAAPTASAGTNTTQLATTAFVLANGGAAAPSAVNFQTTTYTIVAGDKGKVIDLTGTFTLTGPTASSGFYFYVRKRDGSGDVTFSPASGTVDGRSSIHIYQENFMIWCDGTNWWTQGRPKGWVNISSVTVGSAVASVTFAVGFGDTELRDMQFDANGMTLSAATNFFGRVSKSAAIQTTAYISSVLYTSGTTPSVDNGAVNGFPFNDNGGSGIMFFSLDLFSFASTVAANQRASFRSFVQTSGGITTGEGFHNTAVAIDSFVIVPNTGNVTGGIFKQKGFRP